MKVLSHQPSSRPVPWLDYDLSDREGEEWRDVTNYDGLYQVSSHGRVKGLARVIHRQNRGSVRFPEKIMHQSFNGGSLARVGLSEEGIKSTHAVLQLVGTAFMPKLAHGHIWYHRDKYDILNNGLSNIISGTVEESNNANCRAGLIPNLEQAGQLQRDKKSAHDNAFNVLSAGEVIARVCSGCMVEQTLDNFSIPAEGRISRLCKSCKAKRAGTLDVGAFQRKVELAKAGLRVCGSCKQTKRLDNAFGNNKHGYLGKHSICKVCTSLKQKADWPRRRQEAQASNQTGQETT